ncbi:MAG: GNAT family protein [Myxococcota bacterium]|nr:GNAT family protein [Myxococcota bacterium]
MSTTPSPIRTDLGAGPFDDEGFRLRPFEAGDRESVVRHLDDRGMWRNLTDRIASPYTLADADFWLGLQREQREKGLVHNFAIEIDGEACGSIGIEPLDDLHRRSAEIGYWLGRAHWGRGIATRALARVTRLVFDSTDLVRLQATVLDWNPASCRVAEKCGYEREGILRKAIFKDGQITDAFLYARVREDTL